MFVCPAFDGRCPLTSALLLGEISLELVQRFQNSSAMPSTVIFRKDNQRSTFYRVLKRLPTTRSRISEISFSRIHNRVLVHDKKGFSFARLVSLKQVHFHRISCAPGLVLKQIQGLFVVHTEGAIVWQLLLACNSTGPQGQLPKTTHECNSH